MEEQRQVVTETVVRPAAVAGAAVAPAPAHPAVEATSAGYKVEQIIWLIVGILEAILALRFVLALLGADRTNAFAHFIYAATYPFVAPFFGLFGYRFVYGVAHLEIETLVAMGVYALIAWGITKLVNIVRT